MQVKFPSVNYTRNKNCALEAFKCLNGLASSVYAEYFTRSSHTSHTRGNKPGSAKSTN